MRRRASLLLLVTLGAFPAITTSVSAEPSDTTLGPVRVAVSDVSPAAPGPGETLTVIGRLVNAGSTAVPGLSVRLRIDHNALTSRAALAEAATASPDAVPPDSAVVPASSIVTEITSSLEPGQSVPFQIGMPTDDLQLSGFGVHTLTVEVRSLPIDGVRVTVGSTRTFIVWSDGDVPTVRVSWLVPLQDRPLRDSSGRYDKGQANSLAASLDSGGRLSTLVSAGTGQHITWAVDPDLLEEAVGLAAGAPLVGGGTTTPDTGAENWLKQLKAASDVRALPYADPDLTAQRRAALSEQLPSEVSTGVKTASTILGRPISAAPAWPVNGLATTGILKGAKTAGLKQLLLSSDAVRTPTDLTSTPNALGTLSGTDLQVVTADSALSDLAATDPRELGNNTLARLRLLAETAMIAAERPNDPRSVVIALPRSWAPAPEWANLLLTMNTVAPWIVPVDLSALTTSPGDAPARRLTPYASTDAAAEVSAAQLRLVRLTTSRLQRFAEILTDTSAYVPGYTAALQRSQSAAWRDDPPGGQLYVQSVADGLAADTGKVRILPRGQVTLSSRTGRIPLTVRNDLSQDVNVGVDLTATPAFRLRMGRETNTTVAAGGTASVEVAAATSADGRIPVQARLRTPSGQLLGNAVNFELRATGYGQVARLVAGGLVVLLAIALIVRVVRRIQGGAAAADAAARDIMAEEAEQR